MAVGAGLGLGERHRLQPRMENLPSCWSGTSGTLLAQFGTSAATKGAAPVLAGHWMWSGFRRGVCLLQDPLSPRFEVGNAWLLG